MNPGRALLSRFPRWTGTHGCTCRAELLGKCPKRHFSRRGLTRNQRALPSTQEMSHEDLRPAHWCERRPQPTRATGAALCSCSIPPTPGEVREAPEHMVMLGVFIFQIHVASEDDRLRRAPEVHTVFFIHVAFPEGS